MVAHRPFEAPDPVFIASDGIESVPTAARIAAGKKEIGLMGASIDQQFLAAGLVDAIRIVLLGGGRRLFETLPGRIELEQTRVTDTSGVTHIEYQVVR